jgi:hypothetical protein
MRARVLRFDPVPPAKIEVLSNYLAWAAVPSGSRRPRCSHRSSRLGVCTENLIRIDCVTESLNVNTDDRALLPLPEPVRLAVQVEEPT